jgi:hypothetical protein
MGWNARDLTAVTGAPNAASMPSGYVFEAFGTHHVTYLGIDGHTHELLQKGAGWIHNDLTAATASPHATNTAIGNILGCTQHVVFFGAAIDELWRDGAGWHYINIKGAANAVGITATGRPIGYAFAAQQTQHVIFPDGLGHIQQLWWETSSGWHHVDLTAAANAPLNYSNPTGHIFDSQGTQHVNYIGKDTHVYELWQDRHGWHYSDLTAATGAPLGEANREVVGYVFPSLRARHVDYLGQDGHIHELSWDHAGWRHLDLTAAAGAPDAGGAPHGFRFAGTRQAIYRGVDNHIHELSWDGAQWRDADLTAATGALPTQWAQPMGYAFETHGSQHVIYGGDNAHVMELVWTP